MTPDTTTLDYWLNWRFLLCLLWVLSFMVLATYLIWRYEGSNSSKTEDIQNQQDTRRSIYADEAWMPCVRGIHPGWLLAFRIFGFLMLLGMLITDVVVDGFGIFFFYTQWTFALVTIYFGMNAGAVILTDCVFWFIIYPFLTTNDHRLSALKIVTHSVNAIFLIGDTVLNCLKFPWFRMAYFILWTATFVIFQWIVHALVSIEWPYPILELSSPSPLWYLLVALMHLPCYGFFCLLIKLKGYLVSRCLPHSYQFLS